MGIGLWWGKVGIFKVVLNYFYLKIQFFVLNFVSLFVWLVVGLFDLLALCTSSGAVSQRDSVFYFGRILISFFIPFLWCPCGCLKFLDFTLGWKMILLSISWILRWICSLKWYQLCKGFHFFSWSLLHVNKLVGFVSWCLQWLQAHGGCSKIWVSMLHWGGTEPKFAPFCQRFSFFSSFFSWWFDI